MLEERLAGEAKRHPRSVGLEERFATLLPEVLIGIGLDQFAALAAKALEPRPVAEVACSTSTRRGSACASRLRSWWSGFAGQGAMTFRALCGDSPDTLTTVARFLALLELFREGAVGFDQVTPLGELTVRWTGEDDVDAEELVTDEFDGAPPEAEPTTGGRMTTVTETDDAGDPGRRTACAPAPLAGGGADGGRPAARRRRTGHRRRATRSRGSSPSCQLLAEEYDEQGRGFELRNVAGGWRYYTREEYAAVVEAFVLEGQQARLTQAALETLAVVAYKQPVSRARVSAIRGVNVDGVMRTLLTRGLVEEAGGRRVTGAHLYRTTGYFLERIGVQSLDELPELAPYLPDLADMEDELEAVATRSHPEPHPHPETPEPGPSTEPDGGTEPT